MKCWTWDSCCLSTRRFSFWNGNVRMEWRRQNRTDWMEYLKRFGTFGWQKNVQNFHVFFSNISNFRSSSSFEFHVEWITIYFIQKYSNKIKFFLDFRMGISEFIVQCCLFLVLNTLCIPSISKQKMSTLILKHLSDALFSNVKIDLVFATVRLFDGLEPPFEGYLFWLFWARKWIWYLWILVTSVSPVDDSNPDAQFFIQY